MTTARKFRRRELREAKHDAKRAWQRSIAGCATKAIPRTAKEIQECEGWLYPELSERETQLRSLIAESGMKDAVVYAIIPDEDDRESFRTQAKVCALEGNEVVAARLLAMASTRVTVIPMERSELLAQLRASEVWGQAALDLLNQPPTGALLCAYDGGDTGHGVMAIGGLMSMGGAA